MTGALIRLHRWETPDMTAPPTRSSSSLPSSAIPPVRVHLALGGNIGDRKANLIAALARLADGVAVDRQSAVYETAPMYVTDQPAFLNMAVSGLTTLSPMDLLAFLKDIESSLGRDLAGLRFGPRPIDLDILLYEGVVLTDPVLGIPHPRMVERAFVLCPLADIAADTLHPVLGRSVGALAAEVPGRDTVVRVAETLLDW